MNSEKVKEIKKALEDNANDSEHTHLAYIEDYRVKLVAYRDILTLINELESENERLKWEKQTLEDEDTLLVKLGEIVQENQQLKDRNVELESELEKEQINNLNCDTELQYKEKRIVELEKENETKTDTIANLLKKQEFYETEKLKQFAERLKEKKIRRQEFIGELAIDDIEYVKTQDIDKTLKEFIENV